MGHTVSEICGVRPPDLQPRGLQRSFRLFQPIEYSVELSRDI